jgi:hypothetical protein
MSNRTSKEIECLKRLDELISLYETLLDFLQDETLISKEERKGCNLSSDRAKWLWTVLGSLSKTNKIQLLEYHWQVLPVELVKITLVTDRNSREFSYGF